MDDLECNVIYNFWGDSVGSGGNFSCDYGKRPWRLKLLRDSASGVGGVGGGGRLIEG